jgi:hypothetical protein
MSLFLYMDIPGYKANGWVGMKIMLGEEDAGYMMLDAGCWMLDAGYKIRDSRSLMNNCKINFAHFVFFWALHEIDTRMRRMTRILLMQDTRYWILDTGYVLISKQSNFVLFAF